jgi:hypothetical protein
MKGGFIMRAIQTCGFLACLAVLLLLATFAAYAGPYVPVPDPVRPIPGCVLPPPDRVPGKEYSNHSDRAGFPTHAPDPEQVIMWDGTGGTADTFDYTGSRAAAGDSADREVDGLANLGDALFDAVIQDKSFLLFSTDDDPNIYYEAPHCCLGSGVWATPPQIDQLSPNDVDGLEVWGPEGADDANRYSLEDDPLANAGRVSVWAYNSAGANSTPYILASEIADAIGRPDLADTIDLDAMMTLDSFGSSGAFDIGDKIMFSIDPIDVFDGGEIWVWDGNPGIGTAQYLHHGCHEWNTAFDVQGTFGTASENINALEAASTPEPGSILLFGFGLAGLVGFALRRRKNKK